MLVVQTGGGQTSLWHCEERKRIQSSVHHVRHLGVVRVLERKAHRPSFPSCNERGGTNVAHRHCDLAFTAVWRVLASRLEPRLEHGYRVPRRAKHSNDLCDSVLVSEHGIHINSLQTNQNHSCTRARACASRGVRDAGGGDARADLLRFA
jgi:hypothetical protein